MATKRRKTAPRYAVNISLKAWDIAKAGAAVTFKVRDRDGLLGTIEIGQGTFGAAQATPTLARVPLLERRANQEPGRCVRYS